MAEVPDAWPPPDAEGREKHVAPLFPLPSVFLFPRLLLPLHIFEPRYRQMIEDSLDGPGRIVLGTILEESIDAEGKVAEIPSVMPIAGVGEIARHEKLADGRFYVWLLGLARVRIAEIESERLYRKVEFELLEESTPDKRDSKRLYERLCEAVLARVDTMEELPNDTALLADLLSQRLSVPQLVMESIYGEPDVIRRAELALAAHEEYPPAESDKKGDEDDDNDFD